MLLAQLELQGVLRPSVNKVGHSEFMSRFPDEIVNDLLRDAQELAVHAYRFALRPSSDDHVQQEDFLRELAFVILARLGMRQQAEQVAQANGLTPMGLATALAVRVKQEAARLKVIEQMVETIRLRTPATAQTYAR